MFGVGGGMGASRGGGRVALVVARDGAEALARLRDVPPPDFLILDLGLPRLDGWAVLKTKKEDPRLAPIPTIILTGDAAPEHIEEGFTGGTNAYLLKPVRGAPLAEALSLLAREEAGR